VATVRERLAVSKQGSYRFHMTTKLNEVEGKEKYRVEVSNRLAAFEDLYHYVGTGSAWETIRENINI
jgi:hypothetical protein